MHFTTLRLKQFRNYPYLELEPSEGITVLYGPNGSGKTNLLEAMHLLSLGPEPPHHRRPGNGGAGGSGRFGAPGRPAVWMDGTRSKFA